MDGWNHQPAQVLSASYHQINLPKFSLSQFWDGPIHSFVFLFQDGSPSSPHRRVVSHPWGTFAWSSRFVAVHSMTFSKSSPVATEFDWIWLVLGRSRGAVLPTLAIVQLFSQKELQYCTLYSHCKNFLSFHCRIQITECWFLWMIPWTQRCEVLGDPLYFKVL